MAVNRPTDTAVKERDVNNKLQLYGIYSGTFQHHCATSLALSILMRALQLSLMARCHPYVLTSPPIAHSLSP